MSTTVVVCKDADVLAHATAARLLTRIVDAQAARGEASVVLTGGGVGIATLQAVRASSARAAVDWSRVSVWWGDERYVPGDDDERNDKQAREALLDALPLDPRRVHPMPAADGPDGADVDAAAARYADQLAAAAPHGKGIP
ncbi:MAG: pgl, partial [Frankiales bacterium]|nr:pgl [Frankiales bacterium]